MTTPEGWKDNDVVIPCRRATFEDPNCLYLKCDLCSIDICAAPITAKLQGKAGCRIVCLECWSNLLPGNQVKFMGRIMPGDNLLPNISDLKLGQVVTFYITGNLAKYRGRVTRLDGHHDRPELHVTDFWDGEAWREADWKVTLKDGDYILTADPGL